MCLRLDDAARAAAARHIAAELHRQAKRGDLPYFEGNVPGTEPEPRACFRDAKQGTPIALSRKQCA